MPGQLLNAKTVNNYINQVKAELFKLYTQLQMLSDNVTAEILKNNFTGNIEKKKTLLDVLDYHNGKWPEWWA